MHPVITIALLTVHEAARRRILLAALLLGGAFLAIYATGFYFAHDNVTAEQLVDAQRRIVFNMLAMAGLYAVNFLTVMASILIPIDTISGEIDPAWASEFFAPDKPALPLRRDKHSHSEDWPRWRGQTQIVWPMDEASQFDGARRRTSAGR